MSACGSDSSADKTKAVDLSGETPFAAAWIKYVDKTQYAIALPETKKKLGECWAIQTEPLFDAANKAQFIADANNPDVTKTFQDDYGIDDASGSQAFAICENKFAASL